VSAPVDSLIFLVGADMVVPGVLAWSTAITSIASKWAGTYVAYVLLKRRERRLAA